jgi:hypothetical protein
VRSEATIEPVMTRGVDTTELRDGGFDRDLFGHRADFRKIDTRSAAATRPAETYMRGGLWSPATTSSRQLGRRCMASRAVRHTAIVLRLRTIVVNGLGSELLLPADTPARQTGQAAFICLAVDIHRRASAEVRTRQTSAEATACSEGILVAMEVAAAIPMVITTRAKGGLVSDAAMQAQPSGVPPFALHAARRHL